MYFDVNNCCFVAWNMFSEYRIVIFHNAKSSLSGTRIIYPESDRELLFFYCKEQQVTKGTDTYQGSDSV